MRRRVWTTQPPAGTPIDWDSPLAQGLLFAYVPTNMGLDLVGRERGAAVAGVATPLTIGQGGVTGQWTETSSLAYSAAAGVYAPATLSVFAYMRAASGLGSNSTLIAKETFGNSGKIPSYGLIVNYNGIGALAFSLRQGGAQKGPLPTYSPPVTRPVAIAGTYDGTTASVYADGVLLGATSVSGSPQYGSGAGNSLLIGGLSDSSVSGAWGGDIYLATLWGRGLFTQEVGALSREPWQLFHKRRRAYSLITGSTISASISESVTSADSYALSATAAAAISEAATSADAYATSATIFATLTETIAPSDAYAIAVTVAAALDSAAAASSALTAVVTIAATIAEVSTAQDTLGVTATILAAIAEAATATDTQATGSVTSAAYAESATAAAIFNATVSIAATLTEAGLAADQIAAMATVAADLAESGAASDAYLRSVLLAVELLENAAAADELSATAFEQIIDAAKTIITILQARDTVNIVQARDTVNIVQALDTLRILQ